MPDTVSMPAKLRLHEDGDGGRPGADEEAHEISIHDFAGVINGKRERFFPSLCVHFQLFSCMSVSDAPYSPKLFIAHAPLEGQIAKDAKQWR